jgi:hypothetical protein
MGVPQPPVMNGVEGEECRCGGSAAFGMWCRPLLVGLSVGSLTGGCFPPLVYVEGACCKERE